MTRIGLGQSLAVALAVTALAMPIAANAQGEHRNHASRSVQHTAPARGSHGSFSQRRSYQRPVQRSHGNRGGNAGHTYTHSGNGQTWNNGNGHTWNGGSHTWTGHSGWHNGGSTVSPGRPSRFYGGDGNGYRVNQWRHMHPDWNGRYYYHSGGYYYDSGYSYPAVIDNEWGGIAALAGGAALIGALNNDPTLFFAGSVGALYAVSRYDSDLHGSREGRLRAAYFGKPYFWRDGTRYDRVTVNRGGREYYRFRRH